MTQPPSRIRGSTGQPEGGPRAAVRDRSYWRKYRSLDRFGRQIVPLSAENRGLLARKSLESNVSPGFNAPVSADRPNGLNGTKLIATEVAARFSRAYATSLVPGIGTTSSGCANSQAKASCPGWHPLSAAS